ncbi:MAG: carboxypeptidase-like regulatory domain-containing protein [Nodosilinea sp. WJT8-NPBG4]|jgi:hypothetical protein|nr:carboxypeptidase-like regulatory domain-containing protein [Nodosilinea sp. WJT8-NPBG4]
MKSWIRGDKIAIASLAVAALTAIATVSVPEIRCKVGLEECSLVESYAGQVLDIGDGLPIGGAKVTLLTEGTPVIVFTDTEGFYRFSIDKKQVTLTGSIKIESDGYNFYERFIEISPDRIENIRLEKTEKPLQLLYTGRILVQEGKTPIAGAKVILFTKDTPVVRYSDTEGVYQFSIDPQEIILTGVIRVEADEYEPYERNIEITNDYIEDIRLIKVSPPPEPPPPVQETISNVKQGMTYKEAREIWINQGWQAQIPGSLGSFPNLEDPTIKYLFEDKGFQEVQDCSGTGRGFCLLKFFNETGEKLSVTTVNNQPGEEPTVYGWVKE